MFEEANVCAGNKKNHYGPDSDCELYNNTENTTTTMNDTHKTQYNKIYQIVMYNKIEMKEREKRGFL